MITIGYIKNIDFYNIRVRFTPYDGDCLEFKRNVNPIDKYKIGDIVFFDKNVEHTEDNLVQFSDYNNIGYEVEYSCQHVLHRIGSRLYDTDDFYNRLKRQKTSLLLINNVFRIIESDYLEKLIEYVNFINIQAIASEFKIVVITYTHRTSEGEGDERYELKYPSTDSSYIQSFFPPPGGWCYVCVNNFPQQNNGETYMQAVSRLESKTKSDLIQCYSKEKHLIKLLEECILIKEEYKKEEYQIHKLARTYFDYPIEIT